MMIFYEDCPIDYQLFCSYTLPQKDMVLHFCEEEVAFLKVIFSSFDDLNQEQLQTPQNFFNTFILLDLSKHKISQVNQIGSFIKTKMKEKCTS